MKTTIVIGGIVLMILTILFFTLSPKVKQEPTVPSPSETASTTSETGSTASPTPDSETPTVGKIKADVFTGKLEEVNTGCFSDGECYVVVGGKHVTTLIGWSQNEVGQTLGVEGFGDLEGHIGEIVEVYAQVNTDGTYTLYGSEGFYVKLLDDRATTPPISKPVTSCVVGGCSGQLCVEAGDDTVTDCMWREEYACYETTTCERQASTGQCGWTLTTELQACLTTN